MPKIERSVDVDESTAAAERDLREFSLRKAIGGNGSDDEIGFSRADGCERAGEARFGALDPERTRVTLSVDYDQSESGCEAAVRQHVDSELQRFGRYAEQRQRKDPRPPDRA